MKTPVFFFFFGRSTQSRGGRRRRECHLVSRELMAKWEITFFLVDKWESWWYSWLHEFMVLLFSLLRNSYYFWLIDKEEERETGTAHYRQILYIINGYKLSIRISICMQALWFEGVKANLDWLCRQFFKFFKQESAKHQRRQKLRGERKRNGVSVEVIQIGCFWRWVCLKEYILDIMSKKRNKGRGHLMKTCRRCRRLRDIIQAETPFSVAQCKERGFQCCFHPTDNHWRNWSLMLRL